MILQTWTALFHPCFDFSIPSTLEFIIAWFCAKSLDLYWLVGGVLSRLKKRFSTLFNAKVIVRLCMPRSQRVDIFRTTEQQFSSINIPQSQRTLWTSQSMNWTHIIRRFHAIRTSTQPSRYKPFTLHLYWDCIKNWKQQNFRTHLKHWRLPSLRECRTSWLRSTW